MAKEVLVHGPYSPELIKALESTQTITGLGGSSDAIDFISTWKITDAVDGLQDEARAALVDAETDLEQCTPDAFRKWVIMLGTMCKGKFSEDEAEAKLRVYSMISPPRSVITEGSVKRAARKFSKYGFPSYGELDEFFEDEARPFIERVKRLEKIANYKKKLAAPSRVESQSDRANHAAKVMADLAQKMSIKDIDTNA